MELTSPVCKGTLDIIVQRNGQQKQGSVLFVQNNFYYDAFFLNAIGEGKHFFMTAVLIPRSVLNGACNNGWCTDSNGSTYSVSVSLISWGTALM